MKKQLFPIFIWMFTISFVYNCKVYSQGFEIKKVSDNVSIVSNPILGSSQVVVQSDKGLVVFDSFMSEITAKKFKNEISSAIGRDDFSFVINIADRLDMIGGNAAYKKAVIVGHDNILKKFHSEKIVEEEINKTIEMWKEKVEYSVNRLKNYEAGSDKARKEEIWMNKCKTMVNELEQGFSLVLPDISYNDKIMLNLGNIKINLFWFGNAGNYQGLTLAVIPENKLAIISKEIFYPKAHMAPYPFPYYGLLDVPRWITILEQVIEGDNSVNTIILSDSYEVYSREQIKSHLRYIKELWNSVKALEAKGMSLQEIQDQLSLENNFAYAKEWDVYKNNGDNWIRIQHEMHIRLFFLQGKNISSEILKNGGPEFLQSSLSKIKKLGNDVYFDEISMDFLAYQWMSNGNTSEAIELYKLNVETFPKSSQAYASLGAGYMKIGDNENAIKNFKKSLELNPGNDNAKKMLEELMKKPS